MANELKITEVQQSQSLQDNASVLITQEHDGIETLYRSPYAQLFAKLAGKTPAVTELPTPSAENRGSIVIYDDGRGDLLYVCVGNTDGTYEWLPIGEDPLPPVTSQDNGKVLAVSDGTWTPKLINEMPDVTEEDDGKILRVDGVGGWNVSKDLTTLEDKVPWDIYEVIEDHAEFDGENLMLEGNNINYDSGYVVIDDTNITYDNGYVIFP